MAKTSKQVEGDIYKLLRDSTLFTLISGNVYREGMRPKDSDKEDAVVIFTAGVPGQIQTGAVTVHIYVPAADPYDDGTLTEDGERCEEVERLAQAWVDSLTAEVSCYMFEQPQTVHTAWNDEIKQSFVVVKLNYRYFGDDYAPLTVPQEATVDATDTDDDKGYAPTLVTEDGDEVYVTPLIEKR